MFEKILSLLETIANELKLFREFRESHIAVGTVATLSSPTPSATVTQTTPTQSVQASVTREQCGQALVDLAIKKSRDVAAAVLAKFGAQLVKEVKDADIPKFYAAIQEAGK